VEDAEAEPVEVVVHGRQVVHVEHHGRPTAGAVLRLHAHREAGWRYRSRDLRGISFPIRALVELNRRRARRGIVLLRRSDLIWFEARKGKSSTNRGTRATSMIFFRHALALALRPVQATVVWGQPSVGPIVQ
jgi:hypothetical protein